MIDRENMELRAYINASDAGSACKSCPLPSEPITTTYPLALAQKGVSSEYGLQGRLDDVRIYTRVLEVCEIEALYNGGAGLPQDGVE